MIQAIIFDLDDTLYPENDFVRSGYRAVARHVAEACGVPFEAACSSMMASFEASGRESVFPGLLERFPQISLSLAELVQIYRQHDPSIRLSPDYLSLLESLSQNYRLGIITDGLPSVQEKKVKALGLDSIIEKIIYSWDYGVDRQKPHPYAFSLILEFLQTDPAATLFIGDNPEKDGRGAQNSGMRYAQIQHSQWKPFRRGTTAQSAPEFVIGTLLQLPQLLQQLN